MERYKAVLWRTEACAALEHLDLGSALELLVETTEILRNGNLKRNDELISTPIDSALLEKNCHLSAEDIFFNQRDWERSPDYHIEIEDMPRIVERDA